MNEFDMRRVENAIWTLEQYDWEIREIIWKSDFKEDFIMKYTTEEIKIIEGHIKAIENYCKTEIAPLINDTVCVDFSETQYRSDGSAFKKTYKFIVEKDGTPSFRSSAFTMVIDENYKREDCSSYGNAYDEWYSMQQLLTRWQKVKSKLNEEINRQKRLKSEILNFQI